MLQGQLLHPLKHAHFGERTVRGPWSLPDSKLHNHHKLSGTKVAFLALKEFQDLCLNNIVLTATDNTTVVAYINKDWGDEVGPSVCPSVENPDLVLEETGDSQSPDTFQTS